MPTYNLNSTLHLTDSFVSAVTENAPTFALNSKLYLSDEFLPVVTGVNTYAYDLVSKLYLTDVFAFSTVENNQVFALNSKLYLTDDFSFLSQTGDVYNLRSVLYITDEFPYGLQERIEMGDGVSYGDTEENVYKEYSHRFRWTNLNGKAIPDLNFKDLTEPIIAVIPAPSFLQFKYDNSFLIFTRNTINRFVLDADIDTGQWRARADNLIQEFKDLGLMEKKTLVLANDTLFGLSEKGVWKWNKKGMGLISKDIIEIPDSGSYEYIGFHNAIRNQYILHKQETGNLYTLERGVQQLTGYNFGGFYQPEYVGDDKVALLTDSAGVGSTQIGEIDRTNLTTTWGTEEIPPVISGLGQQGRPGICRMCDTTIIMGKDDKNFIVTGY